MVSTFNQPNYAAQSGSVYATAIDDAVAVMKRPAAAFGAHESNPLAMTVTVDAGAIFAGGALTEIAAQTTAVIAAPTTDPRIDRIVVDSATGIVSVVQGAEAASPAAPSIPNGTVPIAQVALGVSQTEITNADITDERVFGGGGDGVKVGTIEWFSMKTPPAGRLKANGAAVSRAVYAALFAAITFTDSTVDTTNASTTATMDDTSNVEEGYTIEGAGIPVGTTVISVDSPTALTLSQAATATAANITARFLPHGGGDGSTTFTLPDMRAEVPRGWDDGRGVDSGRAFGSAQLDQMQQITGSFGEVVQSSGGIQSSAGAMTKTSSGASADGGPNSRSRVAVEFDSANSPGARVGAETRSRNVALLVCIKF